MRVVLSMVLCASALSALAGCGRAATVLDGPTRPVASPALVLPTAEEPTPTEPASVTGTGVPAGLPDAFPLPAGTVVVSEVIDAEEGTSFTVAVDVAAGPGAAAAAYGRQLASAGYGVETLADAGGPVTVTFTRGGEREQGAATFEADGAGTRVSVTLTVVE